MGGYYFGFAVTAGDGSDEPRDEAPYVVFDKLVASARDTIASFWDKKTAKLVDGNARKTVSDSALELEVDNAFTMHAFYWMTMLEERRAELAWLCRRHGLEAKFASITVEDLVAGKYGAFDGKAAEKRGACTCALCAIATPTAEGEKALLGRIAKGLASRGDLLAWEWVPLLRKPSSKLVDKLVADVAKRVGKPKTEHAVKREIDQLAELCKRSAVAKKAVKANRSAVAKRVLAT
jgi:hypothetical protein